MLSIEQRLTLVYWWFFEPLRYNFYKDELDRGKAPMAAFWSARSTPRHFL